MWNFPNCLEALDGKHITIRSPINSGSLFYNYKHNFSIVLIALVDANSKCLYVDVECNDRVSDGGVFNGCTLQTCLDNCALYFPDLRTTSGDERPLAFTIIACNGIGGGTLKGLLTKTSLQHPYTDQFLTSAPSNSSV